MDYKDASGYMEIAEDYLSDLYQRDQYQIAKRCKVSVTSDTSNEAAVAVLTEAIQFFANAGNYKDSAEQRTACLSEIEKRQFAIHHQKGTMLLQEAVYSSEPALHFQQAYNEFCLAEDYSDAKAQAQKCAERVSKNKLNQAISFLSTVESESFQGMPYSEKKKQLTTWIQVLESIIDYKNAAEHYCNQVSR